MEVCLSVSHCECVCGGEGVLPEECAGGVSLMCAYGLRSASPPLGTLGGVVTGLQLPGTQSPLPFDRGGFPGVRPKLLAALRPWREWWSGEMLG